MSEFEHKGDLDSPENSLSKLKCISILLFKHIITIFHPQGLEGASVPRVIQELLPVLPGLSAKVLPEILSRLTSRVMARLIRDALL